MDDGQTERNRHPADELAEVRHRIRELREQEDDLRSQLLGLPTQERIGSKYVAIVIDKQRRVIDIDKLEKEIGDIKRFYRNTEFVMLRCEKLR